MIHLSWIINGSDHDPIHIHPLTCLSGAACCPFTFCFDVWLAINNNNSSKMKSKS
ncbi:hypothetical protein HanIR_Chr12g0611501 [Helianthus annuus]|nr:hypothetical protein HanIR_Chr12g0611501 [Helianthus annuus]